MACQSLYLAVNCHKRVTHALYYLFTGLSLLSICLFLASELLGIRQSLLYQILFGGIVFIF